MMKHLFAITFLTLTSFNVFSGTQNTLKIPFYDELINTDDGLSANYNFKKYQEKRVIFCQFDPPFKGWIEYSYHDEIKIVYILDRTAYLLLGSDAAVYKINYLVDPIGYLKIVNTLPVTTKITCMYFPP